MPHACIGADVITGFPGEEEQDFNDTYQFLLDLPVSYLHVFTYSERDNTTALRISEVVPMDVRNERTKRLRILSEKKKRQFYESQIGQTRPVLFEAENTDGMIQGFTDNYLKVIMPFDANFTNTIKEIKLEKLSIDCNFLANSESLINS
jgi:threonylcarbamoyladenosine tRNA methylthiotransferase MtaB